MRELFEEEKKMETDDMAPLIPETKVNWNSNTGISEEDHPVPQLSEEDHPVPQLAKTEDHDDYASMEELVMAAAPEDKAHVPAKKSNTVVRFAGYSLRTFLLDVPLFIILVTFFACLWLHHVHDAYLEPQLQALLWTDERAAEEITYYLRECDATDMTTHDGAELFLPPDVTPEEAYEHQLLHGFSVFPGVLAPTTADNLRNYVMSKNRNLTEDESIFVIAGENRFSFGLGTEEPSVTAAMMELANSERLRPTLEKVLGPNPSLIEMTAITSSYGAEAQYWHDDVIPTASAIKYARSFGPSYSVFIQLQNTTKEMGATSACPGSYYCSGGSMDTYCDEDGFQVVGEDGHWNTGDALLMNMNSYHRGSAHIDPNGIDRVMLILTFVPRPNKRAESRQMSQGITFSLRWDMWGHTLDDLAHADTAMAQPWATLRALGLYKLPGYTWGIDYVTGASMRMANDDNGFSVEELDTFLERGGIKWLPQFLQGKVTLEESWHEFYLRTLELCENFAKEVSVYATAGYFAMFCLLGLASGKPHRLPCVGRAVRRLTMICGAASLLFLAAKRHVDQTDWAADIRSNLRYTSAVANEENFVGAFEHVPKLIPTTFPMRKDVLIETRHGSEYLAMYNDFVDGHPGNRVFRSLVQGATSTYENYPEFLREATARYIAGSVEYNEGRFLLQGLVGDWILMDQDATIAYVKTELKVSATPMLKRLRQAIAFIASDYKYGIHRNTALAKHAVPHLKKLEVMLLKETSPAKPKITSKEASSKTKNILGRLFSMPLALTGAKEVRRRSNTIVSYPPEEPYSGAWLKAGDTVEALFDGYYYWGTIGIVTAHGYFVVQYPDGTESVIEYTHVRRPQPFYEDVEVEVLFDGEYYQPCTIVEQYEDGSFHVEMSDDGRHFAGFQVEAFRRRGYAVSRAAYVAAY